MREISILQNKAKNFIGIEQSNEQKFFERGRKTTLGDGRIEIAWMADEIEGKVPSRANEY